MAASAAGGDPTPDLIGGLGAGEDLAPARHKQWFQPGITVQPQHAQHRDTHVLQVLLEASKKLWSWHLRQECTARSKQAPSRAGFGSGMQKQLPSDTPHQPKQARVQHAYHPLSRARARAAGKAQDTSHLLLAGLAVAVASCATVVGAGLAAAIRPEAVACGALLAGAIVVRFLAVLDGAATTAGVTARRLGGRAGAQACMRHAAPPSFQLRHLRQLASCPWAGRTACDQNSRLPTHHFRQLPLPSL